jgi:hypothetical protein
MKIKKDILIIYDDREFTSGEIAKIVGIRNFGSIFYRQDLLSEIFISALNGIHHILHLTKKDDLSGVDDFYKAHDDLSGVLIISSRAGIVNLEKFVNFIKKIQYSEYSISSSEEFPLIVYCPNKRKFNEVRKNFEFGTAFSAKNEYHNYEKITSLDLIDLGNYENFIKYFSSSIIPRHFNQVDFFEYSVKKTSSDKLKMRKEYEFSHLIPNSMKPWIATTYGFQETEINASYYMHRYRVANASLQWVHGAFDANSFNEFTNQLFYFFKIRLQKETDPKNSLKNAQLLYLKKLNERTEEFLSLEEGIKINQLATSIRSSLNLIEQTRRFSALFNYYSKQFTFNYEVIGHGDPCLSNILYEKQQKMMLLIDPLGAIDESGLWTHPYYDLTKISHSILGDYDHINLGAYSLEFSKSSGVELKINYSGNVRLLQDLFIYKIRESHYDLVALRLGEASLFLSMLPLHIDNPNKALAFMIRANEILDYVENTH